MPTGPRGEKRPSNPNAAAIMVAKIATGEIEEEYADGRPWTDDEVMARRIVETGGKKGKLET